MKIFMSLLIAAGLTGFGYYDYMDKLEPTHNMTDEMMLQICIEEGIPL